MPNLDPQNRSKPLAYDPTRKKFILYDEIVAGKEKIIPIDTLSESDLKKLIIERQKSGPDYTVQAISGTPMTRDEVIKAIEQDSTFGQMTVQAEKAYLRDLQQEIQRNLP